MGLAPQELASYHVDPLFSGHTVATVPQLLLLECLSVGILLKLIFEAGIDFS